MLSEMNLPTHVAIIMDGNRRWAKSKNLDKKAGHKEGAENLKRIVSYANQIGIRYMTVYAFSTENWKRTQEEVGALMILLKNYLEDFLEKADTENVRINVIGNISKLSKSLQDSIYRSIVKTKENTGMILNIAFNYGGREEITHAVCEIAQQVKKGEYLPEEITQQTIADHLYTKGQPDPDLLIRTSGEQRLSNFLPWQLVYSEFVFVDKFWPEFNEKDLDCAIEEYNKRNRKFGGK